MESTWIEISFAIDPNEYRRFKKCAEELNLTVQSLLRRNIEEYLRRQAELVVEK